MRKSELRAEAIAKGERTYFTGRPCTNGHVSPKSTVNSTCVTCQNERLAKYRKGPLKRAQNARYYAAHKEAMNKTNLAWLHSHPERRKANQRAYYAANKAKYTADARTRKIAKRRAMPPWADRAAIREVYIEAQRLTILTGIEHHVDHIVPLRHRLVCGLHVPWNLRVVPDYVNMAKHNHFDPAALNILAAGAECRPPFGGSLAA